MPNNEPIPVAEWLTRGRRLFGADPLLWRFRCPVCGHVQALADFKALGLEPQDGYQECIGRHLPDHATNFGSTPGENGQKSPCNFAAYGLIQFGWKVIAESGKIIPVFPFDEGVTPNAE